MPISYAKTQLKADDPVWVLWDQNGPLQPIMFYSSLRAAKTQRTYLLQNGQKPIILVPYLPDTQNSL